MSSIGGKGLTKVLFFRLRGGKREEPNKRKTIEGDGSYFWPREEKTSQKRQNTANRMEEKERGKHRALPLRRSDLDQLCLCRWGERERGQLGGTSPGKGCAARRGDILSSEKKNRRAREGWARRRENSLNSSRNRHRSTHRQEIQIGASPRSRSKEQKDVGNPPKAQPTGDEKKCFTYPEENRTCRKKKVTENLAAREDRPAISLLLRGRGKG